MLFPSTTGVVFAADRTGYIKGRLRPADAARNVKHGRAKKIGDNLIQYSNIWKKGPLSLRRDEIVLIDTVSRFTPVPGIFISSEAYVERIFRGNMYVCRLFLPNLS